MTLLATCNVYKHARYKNTMRIVISSYIYMPLFFDNKPVHEPDKKTTELRIVRAPPEIVPLIVEYAKSRKVEVRMLSEAEAKNYVYDYDDLFIVFRQDFAYLIAEINVLGDDSIKSARLRDFLVELADYLFNNNYRKYAYYIECLLGSRYVARRFLEQTKQ